MNRVISYAQNREDLILDGFFDKSEVGFYVDVGANSPTIDSVTNLFYDKGWSGINIEPIRNHFEQIEKLRPRDTNLNIGIASKTGALKLREYEGTGLSTFSPSMKNKYSHSPDFFTKSYKDYEVKVETLATVFAQQKVKGISFMKIDVEGYEYEVLSGNDWSHFRPEVVCIEANHIEKDWHHLLIENRYELAFFDGLNEYFVDSNKPERLEKFSYVDAIINKEPIINYRFLPELNEYEQSRQQLFDLEKEIVIKRREIAHLEATLNEVLPLRRHFKRQVKSKLRSMNQKVYAMLKSRNKYTPLDPTGDSLMALADTDKANFLTYNESTRVPFLLKMYLSVTGFCIRFASRILRITKV